MGQSSHEKLRKVVTWAIKGKSYKILQKEHAKFKEKTLTFVAHWDPVSSSSFVALASLLRQRR